MAQQRVVVDSCEVSFEVVGEGIPVVLVHGLGASSVIWNEVRDSLGPGYRIVLFDLRGAGTTNELERKELSLKTWSADLAGLLATLEIELPILVGHSLGASIALKYALDRPESVRALVLIAADANLSRLRPRMLAAAELIERIGLDEWVAQHWSKNPPFSAVSLERAPTMFHLYRAMLLGNDHSDYVRQCRAIANIEDLEGRLGEVAQPVLVLVGGSDDRTLPVHGRELADRMPNSRLVELPNVGHTLPLEAPTEIAEAVRTFLDDVTVGRGAKPDALRRDRVRLRTEP